MNEKDVEVIYEAKGRNIDAFSLTNLLLLGLTAIMGLIVACGCLLIYVGH